VVFRRVHAKLKTFLSDLQEGNSPASVHRLPSELDLTQKFSCSRVTIRRVLDSLEKRGRIRRMPGKGTFLVGSKDKCESPSRPRIAWLFPADRGLSNWREDILVPLRQRASDKSRNLGLYVEPEEAFPHSSRELVNWARGVGADAVILQPPDYQDPEELAYFKTDVPVVLFNRHSPFPEQIASARTDNYASFRRAVDLLVQFGHRRIAYVGADHGSEPALARANAYRDTLSSMGVEMIYPFCVSRLFGGIFKHVLELLSWKPAPTAIITGGRFYDWPCCQALASSRMNIPEDVSFLAVDDFPQALHYRPPISVLRQPFDLLIEQALELARERILGPDREPRHVALCSELIFRESIAKARD